MAAPTSSAPAPTAVPAPAPAKAEAAPAVSNKLFVGNLSFKTRESDLAHAFEEACKCKVVSANIITRGPRSLGYGFVEVDTEESAKHAAATMNHKEVDGRPINVEVARPREFRPRQQQLPVGQPPAQGQAPVVAQGQAQGQQAPRPRRGGIRSFRGGFQGQFVPQQFVPQQKFYPRPPRTNQQFAIRQQAAPQAGMFPPRQRFPRRPRVPQENRPESKTTLFVANLPFIVDDNNLKEIFADLNIKEAHVVRRQNGRSKGYGFVEFHSEEDRRHALQTLDKIEVEGRELIIKAALTFTPPVAQAPAQTAAPKTEAK